ncbi:MAG: acetyl-CoA carboxylase subunit beta [Elusimicrobia bacterium RIFOXYA2_FULL_50_26]|nr:MAG: acetyl-CoA carboxylase subunit beta [Elusimicrobia bacterium RIFOXYA2_FULL_50_26]OGS24389.1 MAG: acetyl-CoA carboxylase subunit beta [Elusimicrobia bacterium RIFOXYB2_FULL_50_12]
MPVHPSTDKKGIPHGLWTKCKKCEQIIFNKDLEENLKVCPKCGYYFRLGARERINQLIEDKTFTEHDADMIPGDPLSFPDYAKRSRAYSIKEAVVTGEGKLGGFGVMIAVMDFEFMGGSMGSVVGEKITRACEKAIAKKLPFIIVSSSGGARMQEGIFSLMQMAKTSAALARLADEGLPFISIPTDPTTGGVTASFAMLGDVIVSEPRALIGFAGPRVIEQTIRQQLPEGFQLSEFLVQHGMVDIVVERKEMKNTLIKLLTFFSAA